MRPCPPLRDAGAEASAGLALESPEGRSRSLPGLLSVGGRLGGLPDSLALGVQVASNPSSLRAMLQSPSAFQGPSLLKQGAAQASAGTWRAVVPSWLIHATHLQHSVVRSREP